MPHPAALQIAQLRGLTALEDDEWEGWGAMDFWQGMAGSAYL